MTTDAPAYVIGILRDLKMGPPIFQYLEHIDDTLVPNGGRFLVHGVRPHMLEGADTGAVVVVLEFPSRDQAQRWYESEAYQRILPLRTENSSSTVFLVDGVVAGYRATDVLRRT